MKLRALIVDDEPLARERIRELLKAESDFEYAGECSSGREAVRTILRLDPELVFLDVQMPGCDGFEVLRALGNRKLPAVIFVTAYDKYALKAFEFHAIDYLLKPFRQSRFESAVERAREQIRYAQGRSAAQVLALLDDLRPAAPAERFVVKSGGDVLFLQPDEIDYIEAADNYLNIHAGKESLLMRETMQRMEKSLDPRKFVRIHRSTIVNVERIRKLQAGPAGEHLVILRDGQQLTLSRTYRDQMQQRLAIK
jgi:two-component system, LytTR family, response regulator